MKLFDKLRNSKNKYVVPIDNLIQSNIVVDKLQTGITNKYFTTDLVKGAFSSTGSITYNNGIFNFTDAVSSVAGKIGNVTLTKNDVGLNLVDNTSDATKIVKDATKFTTVRNINLSGASTGTISFDGSVNKTLTNNISNTGVVAGTYGSSDYIPQLTVNSAGQITSISNNQIALPLKIGNGSTTQINLTSNNPLNFVEGTNVTFYYDDYLNKLTFEISNKNVVNWSSITGKPTTIAGYGIVDLRTKLQDEILFNNIVNDLSNLQNALKTTQVKIKAYLNGGYQGSTIQQKRVQRFNTITETGSDAGYISSVTSYYNPGGSSKYVGLFFGNTGSPVSSSAYSADAITYSSETCQLWANGNLAINVDGTLYDINTQNYIYGFNGSSQWLRTTVKTKVFTRLSDATAYSITRQMLSSDTFGFTKTSSTSAAYRYSYTSGTHVATINAWNIENYPAGMVRDKNYGYFVGYAGQTTLVTYTTNSISQFGGYTINFGESNTLGTETYGFAMGGYHYNSTQHAKVQKMSYSTHAVTTVIGGDLAYPQSSAGTSEA